MKLYGIPFLLILLALLVGSGCLSVTSKYPLSLDTKPIDKEKFEGVWLDDKEHMPFQFRYTDNGLLKIAFLEWEENDLCVARAEAIVTQGKKHNFFSVRYQECSGEWEGYYFVAYRFTGQGDLTLWLPDFAVFTKVFEKLIENNTIKNEPGALLKILNDPDSPDLFNYREPVVFKKIAGDNYENAGDNCTEQSAAGDVQKAAPEE